LLVWRNLGRDGSLTPITRSPRADSKDVIKLATAVVGTLAALALALLIASARTTYENANAELRTSMARLVLLDRAMAACAGFRMPA
jgi:hypothetical protein